MLSLISISLVVASGDVEKVDEAVKDNYDEDDYDNDGQQSVVVETEVETDAPTQDDPSDDTVKTSNVEEPTNEDTVDVEDVPIGKQQGKYMNYDDYFVASQLDQSDTSYNWNGECPTPDSIDWHIKLLQSTIAIH